MKLWIARDSNGFTRLYKEKPVKRICDFAAQAGTEHFEISHRIFPEITFENSPQEIEINLINNE